MFVRKYFLFVFVLLFAININAQKRAFTIEDLYKVKNVSVPVLSNSGQKIAFTVTEYDLPKGKTITNVYVMNTNGSLLIDVSEKLVELPHHSGLQMMNFIFYSMDKFISILLRQMNLFR